MKFGIPVIMSLMVLMISCAKQEPQEYEPKEEVKEISMQDETVLTQGTQSITINFQTGIITIDDGEIPSIKEKINQ